MSDGETQYGNLSEFCIFFTAVYCPVLMIVMTFIKNIDVQMFLKTTILLT